MTLNILDTKTNILRQDIVTYLNLCSRLEKLWDGESACVEAALLPLFSGKVLTVGVFRIRLEGNKISKR